MSTSQAGAHICHDLRLASLQCEMCVQVQAAASVSPYLPGSNHLVMVYVTAL